MSAGAGLPAGRDEKGRRLVTLDTGGPDDVYPGCLVTWLHVPRGGYGYVLPVDAKVVWCGRTAKTVRIEVVTKDGRTVVRTVDPKNLRWRR
jgi:hypothetical protein